MFLDGRFDTMTANKVKTLELFLKSRQEKKRHWGHRVKQVLLTLPFEQPPRLFSGAYRQHPCKDIMSLT